MGKILYAEKDGCYALKFIGDVRLTLSPIITEFLSGLRELEDFRGMVIDLSEAEAIDSTALGLIAKVGICCEESFSHTLSIVSPNDDITRVLKSMSMQEVCVIVNEPLSSDVPLEELPQQMASEQDLLEQVLDAHRTLMSLDAENETKFKDLVESLEKEQSEKSAPVAKAS